MSSNLSTINKVDGSINFIGGKSDRSADKIKSQHQKVVNMGVKSKIYNPEGTHFLLITHTEEVVDILNLIIK